MEFKYIIDKNNQFAIFSKSLTHADMAGKNGMVAVGAGFCTFSVVEKDGVTTPLVSCFGDSASLGVKSREIDSDIITKAINRAY